MLPKSKIYNQVGQRNNYITVQKGTDGVATGTGEVLPVYTNWINRFVGSKIIGGHEFVKAHTIQPDIHSILEFPYDSETRLITPKDRINDGGRILGIDRVFNENENNEKIIVWTIELVET